MKNCIVLKKIGDFGATVVREFDDENDAIAFTGLLAKSEDNKSISYYTASHVANVPF